MSETTREPSRSSNGGEPTLLTGWGRTSPTLATLPRPTDADEVAALVAAAGPRGILARGLGRSYGDPAQNAGGEVISGLGLRGVRDFDARTGLITVGAGLSIGDLGGLVIPFGWFPPVLPGTSHVTIGGAIAADVHGKNHHREGSFCGWVRSFELVLASGERRTVAADDDLFAATAGGMGLTGVITEATIELIRVESDRMRVDTERPENLDDLMDRMERRDDEYRYSVAWVDCLARGRRLGRSVLMRADHATAAEVAADHGASDRLLDFSPPRALSAPPGVPSGVLSTPLLRAFNEAYFRRAPRAEQGRLESLNSYFRPLDIVADWNRLYGARGLLQYQLVVPSGQEGAMRAAVERLAEARTPAFLAVLKRFGAGRGMLSFPMPGWTLTMDLPAGRTGLAPLLDSLDELVVGAGGRLYLAKDSRLRPELLESMYPELDRWREVRAQVDPQERLRSDQAQRIGLVSRGGR